MENLSEQVEALQKILIAIATNGDSDTSEFSKLRQEIVSNSLLKDIVPYFLRTCRTTLEFWDFIKPQASDYAGRRRFIGNEFQPIFERIEGAKTMPADQIVSLALERFDTDSVHKIWLKALERRETDPEGAITSARTLLETVCKHILDEQDIAYEPTTDLPGLYKLVSNTLDIAPSQHTEPIFKQILGGCTTVVVGLGAIRNRLSDAHGQGKKPVKPAPHHAELAVNLAGAVAVFLISTQQVQVEKED